MLLLADPKSVAQARVTVKVKVKTEINSKRHFVKVVEHHNLCLLDCHKSLVMQAQLDEICEHFYVPHAILIRALGRGKLPQHAYKELDKIPFPVAALKCRVRLSLAPFMRRLLSELSLHSFQVLPPL